MLCSLICLCSLHFFFCYTYGGGEYHAVLHDDFVNALTCCMYFHSKLQWEIRFFYLLFLNILHLLFTEILYFFSAWVCIGSNALRNSKVYLEQGNKLRGNV